MWRASQKLPARLRVQRRGTVQPGWIGPEPLATENARSRAARSETKMGAARAPIHSLRRSFFSRCPARAAWAQFFALSFGSLSGAGAGAALAVWPSVAVPRRNDSAYCNCASFSGSFGT